MATQLDERVQKLIALYARHPISKIQSDSTLLENAFGKPVDELTEEWGFPEAKVFVEELKKKIEDIEDELKVPDQKFQVAQCLHLILNLLIFDRSEKSILEKKLNVLRSLLLQMIAEPAGWSDNQKKHFGFVFKLLKGHHSCFISYTNEGAKGINQKFKHVIDRYVDKDVLNERDHERHNLLADAVLNRLRSDNLRLSFFDKAEIKKNDDLMDRIKPACENTFAFIQLIQRETFKAVERRNWCFEEYQLFVGALHKRLQGHTEYESILRLGFSPVHTDQKKDQLMAAQQPFEYKPWIKCIFQDQLFTVLPVDPDRFDETMHDLSCAIVNLKHRLIENVPA